MIASEDVIASAQSSVGSDHCKVIASNRDDGAEMKFTQINFLFVIVGGRLILFDFLTLRSARTGSNGAGWRQALHLLENQQC